MRFTQEQKDLAANNYGLLKQLIHKMQYKYRTFQPEEIQGVVTEAYCRAIGSFDPSKAALSTWVYRTVFMWCSKYVQETCAKRESRASHVSTSAQSDMVQNIPGDTEFEERENERMYLRYRAEQLQTAIDELRGMAGDLSLGFQSNSKMTFAERVDATVEYLSGGVTLKEIGERHGLSRERIRQVVEQTAELIEKRVAYNECR